MAAPQRLAAAAVLLVVLAAASYSLRTRDHVWLAAGTAGSPAGGISHAVASAPLRRLIAALPKAELHIHIEGTLEPELMLQLAARNNVTLPYANLAEAKKARSGYSDLQSFLDAYQVGLSVLRTEADFEALAAAYLARAAANNITHVEIFYDIQSHLKRGVPAAAVMGGLLAAIAERAAHPTAPVDASLILCLVRELGEVAGGAALAVSLPWLPNITALGLASAEVGHPPEDFVRVFQAAGLLGLHKVAHAGEEGGPGYVWGAVRSLEVERVDHGVHSLDDPALVAYLARAALPITLCPLSNVQLKVYGGGDALLARLRAMLRSGMLVTINSDDPAYFSSSYLNDNYEFIAGVGGLDGDGVAQLARNSFTASFIPPARKRAAYAAIDAALSAWKAEQREEAGVVAPAAA